jgi:hypothetical protein
VQLGMTPTKSELFHVTGQIHITPFPDHYIERCSTVSPPLALNHPPPMDQQHERTLEGVLSKIHHVCLSHDRWQSSCKGIVLHVLHEHLPHLILCIHKFLHSNGWVSTSTDLATASGCHLFSKHRKRSSVLSRMMYTIDK